MPVLFSILMFFFVIGLGLYYLLISRLRSRHPMVWERLGRPNPFGLGPSTALTNHTVETDYAVSGFLSRKEYLVLHDSDITRLAGILRVSTAIYFCCFSGVVIFFLVTLAQGWK